MYCIHILPPKPMEIIPTANNEEIQVHKVHMDLANNERVVIFDIDGTIADLQHRMHMFKGRGKTDWEVFVGECHNDVPIKWSIRLLTTLHNSGFNIALVTSRSDIHREKTVNWLEKYNVPYQNLYMRCRGDLRHTTEVKREIFETFFDADSVEFAIDDDLNVVALYRELGIPCLHTEYLWQPAT